MSDTKNEAMMQHGSFSWNELMTTDLNGAKAFYGELFGWAMESMPTNDMEYIMAKAGDKQAAGLMTMPPEAGAMPPMWGAYVTVDDVDASAKQAEALGGKVMMAPRDIPNIGRFCVICDPQGAAISMITYSGECNND